MWFDVDESVFEPTNGTELHKTKKKKFLCAFEVSSLDDNVVKSEPCSDRSVKWLKVWY